MEIKVIPYSKKWPKRFQSIKDEIGSALAQIDPEIDHIGSTAMPRIAAKPIIDILLGIHDEIDFDYVIENLLKLGYTYYPIYNEIMPYRRFFVKFNSPRKKIISTEADREAEMEKQDDRLAHIHVIPINSVHWMRHIAFRDYLIAHPRVKMEYQTLKEGLGKLEWADSNAYNAAKDPFIKKHEALAIQWYKEQLATNKIVSVAEKTNPQQFKAVIEAFRKTADVNLLKDYAYAFNGKEAPSDANDLNFWARKRLTMALWKQYDERDKALIRWIIDQEIKAQEIEMPYYVLDLAAYMLYKIMDFEDVFKLYEAKFSWGNIFYMDVELIFGEDRELMKTYLTEAVQKHPMSLPIRKTIEDYENSVGIDKLKTREEYINYFENRKIRILKNDLYAARADYPELE